MGGSNEEKIGGYRVHISSGEIHLHDDDKGLKFEMESADFKHEIQDALKEKGDGIIEIAGTGKNSLCLFKTGRTVNVFLKGKSIKTELKNYLRNC